MLRERLEARRPPVKFTRGVERLVAIPYCERDLAGVLNLLGWIRDLGRVPASLLLCAPHGMPTQYQNLVEDQAKAAFLRVDTMTTPFDLPVEGWPTGTCWSFLAIANRCRQRRVDFWLNEPDCIPLKPRWFERLVAEYDTCGRPYMGFIEPGTHDYPRHMTGNGFYNWQVFHHFRADKLGQAWDIAMADVLTPQCHDTRLFHQEFGPLDHPPTFPTVDSLARIPEQAVIFHRNKDGSLIRQLRDQR